MDKTYEVYLQFKYLKNNINVFIFVQSWKIIYPLKKKLISNKNTRGKMHYKCKIICFPF